MFFTTDEYKNSMNTFLTKYHGFLTKICDDDGEIIGYITRCETDEKDVIAFAFTFKFDYIVGNKHDINNKELKYYSIRRSLERWKNKVNNEKYMINYEDFIQSSNEFINDISYTIDYLKIVYSTFRKNNEDRFKPLKIDNKKVAEYILSNFKGIETYYKTKNKKVIFL